jgi:hypothetical protein
MKILLFFLVLTSILFAQEDDYFPFHVGNRWQYYSNPGGEFYEELVTAIDTVLADSAIYIYINNDSSKSYKKLLKDKYTVYYNWYSSTWNEYYKFNVPFNSKWLRNPEYNFWAMYIQTGFTTILWGTFEYKTFWEYYHEPDTLSLAMGAETVLKGIGPYKFEWEGGQKTLSGCIINGTQYGTILNMNDQEVTVPSSLNITAYPNPFNAQVNLQYTVPVEGVVKINIYNTLGELIAPMVNETRSAGSYVENLRTGHLSSGIYYAILQVNDQIKTTKLINLK